MDATDVQEDAPRKKPGYSLAHQTIDLELDFSEQVRGRAEITLYPDSKELREIRLHSKQCQINSILVNGIKPQSVLYQEPCDRFRLHTGEATVHQHHILQEKIGDGSDSDGELAIRLPKSLKIEEVNLAEVHTQNAGTIKIGNADSVDPAEAAQTLADASVARFTPLKISIEFISHHLRDGLQFVLGKPGNGRWPHVYTCGKTSAGAVPCIFPCIDSLTARSTWDITLRYPRTVADAIGQVSQSTVSRHMTANGEYGDTSFSNMVNREMLAVCSGDITDEIVHKDDPNTKIVSFSCLQQLSARQIGFAIGPFERVNLSALRDARDEEELGQNAVDILGYCLPGRTEDLRNTTLPTAQAMDSIVNKYISYPFSTYSMCFVEDAPEKPAVFAGMALCTAHMLYSSDIIDPAQEVTRQLAHAIASQWVGINIVAETPRDMWVIVGISHFIAESFMKDLCGNNEYRFRMKQLAERVFEQDIERPSIYDIGALLHVDSFEYEFLSLKAPLVIFILDRRIAKVAGTSKMPGIIGKILTRARIGDLPGNLLSTDMFQRTCERFYHAKIDDFINQWVKGAGCPSFTVMQRFNKKKLVVEMVIKQIHGNAMQDRDIDMDTFMRDVREEYHEVYAAPVQPVFTGSMTIRIHEADGTPYEHIVDLKEATTTFDIPYNTKYKRLKRSKKQRAKVTVDSGDGENDALLYCLGDVLQSEEEVRDWRLTDWSEEDENRMNAESYEWIRIDADFEWIARIRLSMPGYMSVSQLQQDRDVVAQYDSIRHINSYPPSPLISSIMLRTMVDRRYFHGIRALAAQSLVKHATNTPEANSIGLFHLRKTFEELYCTKEHGSIMTRPNNFSDVLAYFLQGEIIEAISRVRNEEGFAPREVKEFLLDKLKFNDNASNDYSDAFYVSRLMKALCLAVAAKSPKVMDPDSMDLDQIEDDQTNRRIEEECISEIDRYRRMDEWTSSYQNLYSRTALECQHMLNRAGIGRNSTLHFLQYTRPGNYDLLRLKAYEILVDVSLSNMTVLKYVLHCMVADASPLIRQALSNSFGRALASKAIGEVVNESITVQDQDGLVIEDANASEARQKALARRRTVDGAMEALRSELGNNEDLKRLLWNAVNYPDIGENDLRPLLDFCRLLYEPIDQLALALQYPRYWSVENTGGGKLRFFQTEKVRTKKVEKWQPRIPQPAPVQLGAASSKPFKLKLKTNNTSSPSVTPPPPRPAEPLGHGLKLKLKVKPER